MLLDKDPKAYLRSPVLLISVFMCVSTNVLGDVDFHFYVSINIKAEITS